MKIITISIEGDLKKTIFFSVCGRLYTELRLSDYTSMKTLILIIGCFFLILISNFAFAQEGEVDCSRGLKDSFGLYLAKPTRSGDDQNFTLLKKNAVISKVDIETVNVKPEKSFETADGVKKEVLTDKVEIAITLTPSGAKKIKKVTENNIGNYLLFEIGQEIVSHPKIADGISSKTLLLNLVSTDSTSEFFRKLCN